MKLLIKRYLTAFAFCMVLVLPAVAQTNTDLQAIALYNKAELAFNNTAYEEALDYIKEAEELLGRSNSKILYLKIQALDLLFKIDMRKGRLLEEAITNFYTITNRNNYPAEKYMRVATIELELKERLAAEKTDFEKLKTSEEVSEYDAFFSSYPGSNYEAQLKATLGYRKAVENQKISQQKAFEENWRAKNLPLLRKYEKKGKSLIGVGSAFLVAGTGMTAFSVVEYFTEFTWPKDKPKYIDKDNYIDTKDYRKYMLALEDRHLALVGVGASVALAGIIMTPFGVKFMKKAKAMKNDAREKGIQLSYAPVISPVTQKYGVGLCMKF